MDFLRPGKAPLQGAATGPWWLTGAAAGPLQVTLGRQGGDGRWPRLGSVQACAAPPAAPRTPWGRFGWALGQGLARLVETGGLPAAAPGEQAWRSPPGTAWNAGGCRPKRLRGLGGQEARGGPAPSSPAPPPSPDSYATLPGKSFYGAFSAGLSLSSLPLAKRQCTALGEGCNMVVSTARGHRLALGARLASLEGPSTDPAATVYVRLACAPGYAGQDCQALCPHCEPGVSCNLLTGLCDGFLFRREDPGRGGGGWGGAQGREPPPPHRAAAPPPPRTGLHVACELPSSLHGQPRLAAHRKGSPGASWQQPLSPLHSHVRLSEVPAARRLGLCGRLVPVLGALPEPGGGPAGLPGVPGG